MYLEGDGSDTLLTGGDLEDTLLGSAGNEMLFGMGGNDRISGMGGNDALVGGGGNDTLDGGSGLDSVLYDREAGVQGIVADLGSGIVQDTYGNTDQLVSIERIFGSDFADTISGGASGDFLSGGGGDDSILGRAGDDTLIGHAGNDTLDGGAGNDTVIYFTETGTRGVNVNLQTGVATDTWGNTDTLISIERLDGSYLGDTIIGAALGELLFGWDGNDSINGGAGDDTIVGGAGRDTLLGGAGNDRLIYSLEAGTGGVIVNLQTGVAVDTYGTTDAISGFERIYGSNTGDTLVGSDLAGNFLFGQDGDDVITGGNGSGVDSLVGGSGRDTMNGGAGADQVMYNLETGTAGVQVDLARGTAIDTYGATDVVHNVEYVIGTDRADTILGSSTDGERLFGGAGDDYLDGRDGNNMIFTGSGNDTIVVGTTIANARDTVVIDGVGTKTIIGTGAAGSDYDHHLVFAINEAVTVNLATGIATSASMRTDFSAAPYFLEVNGTMHNDLLIGGNPIHDYLEWLSGNQGNDTINGGGGINDAVIYGAEVEMGSYNYALGRQEYGTHGCIVNLATGVATDTFGYTDTLIAIANVYATRYVDVMIGNSGTNGFTGLAGNDTMDGAGGSDRVHYREDSIGGGTSGVRVNLQTGVGIDGYGDRDTLISIEEVYATDFQDWVLGDAADNRLFGYDGDDTLSGAGGDDVILGGNGADSISGGNDDDELWGGAGNDTLDGGGGIDIARYYEDTAGIVANMATGTVRDGEGGLDRLIGIEWLHGSFFADVIAGDAQANQLLSYDGDDTVNGAEGNDTIVAGAGNDSLVGGDGDDELWGGAGADTIAGGVGIDMARYLDDTGGIVANLEAGTVRDGSGATDTLLGIEWLHGSGYADAITGNAQANQLQGYAGNDTINGGAGNDTIVAGAGDDSVLGGDGDDELWGSAGSDTLAGGAGNDVARYLDDAAGIVADLAAGTVRDGSGATDALIGIEWIHGSRYADMISGNALANQLQGYEGNDTILGGAGNDTIVAGSGNDVLQGGDGDDELWGEAGSDQIDGGAGFDTVRYLNESSSISINLGLGRAENTESDSDVLINIEAVYGSAYGDRFQGGEAGEALMGMGGNDTIAAGDGNDTLMGGDGDDSIVGEAGDDELWGEAGNDTLDGGAGQDTLRYINALAGALVSLGDGIASDGMGGMDHLAGFENVHGSQFGDWISGDDGSNRLIGNSGADTLLGGLGSDTLSGGTDADTYLFLAGDGYDVVNDLGGANASDGNDRVIFRDYLAEQATIYQQATSIVFEFGRYATGEIERLILAGAADASSGSAIELIEWADGTVWRLSTLMAHLGQTGTTISRVESDLDDVLSGSAGADTVSGLLGNDRIEGRDGNDLLNGGEGDDFIRGGDGADTMIGGSGNDTLLGGDSALDLRDVIYGGDGNDSIDGGDGNDELRGDAGSDTIEGGNGADTVIGGDGNDTLTGSAWGDVLMGGEGDDFVNGGFGFDRVVGGGGADRFYHLGVAGHGSDWIQDYSSAEGDVLVFGNISATRSQFQVNWSTTPGAGDASVQEAFVIYRETGQILWALIDGAANDHIWLQIGANTYDLLA